jgi:hypothetical protein
MPPSLTLCRVLRHVHQNSGLYSEGQTAEELKLKASDVANACHELRALDLIQTARVGRLEPTERFWQMFNPSSRIDSYTYLNIINRRKRRVL